MSEIIRLELIDPNPHRNLSTFGLDETKITSLCESIRVNGFWSGIVVRPSGSRYQQAFGHHRVEAARREGLVEIKVDIVELDDKQMIEHMLHENNQDYGAHFYHQLNCWTAARNFLRQDPNRITSYPISTGPARTGDRLIAEFLGWVYEAGHIKHVAKVCSAAIQRIEAGQLTYESFANCVTIAAADRVIVALNNPVPGELGPTAQARERAAARAEPAPVPEQVYPPHPTPQLPSGVVHNPPVTYSWPLPVTTPPTVEEIERLLDDEPCLDTPEDIIAANLDPEDFGYVQDEGSLHRDWVTHSEFNQRIVVRESQEEESVDPGYLDDIQAASRRVRSAQNSPTFGDPLTLLLADSNWRAASAEEMDALSVLKRSLEEHRTYVEQKIREVDIILRRYGMTITISQ